MVDKILTLRSNVTGNRPPAGHQPGELYVNFADGQLGAVNTLSVNQDLIGVTIFSTTANYAIGALVAYQGNLYRATAASAAGAFTPANWTQVMTLAGGTFTGGITAPSLTSTGGVSFTGSGTISGNWSMGNYLYMNSGISAQGGILLESNNGYRWAIYKDSSTDTAPSNGANLIVVRYNNSNANLDTTACLSIARSTGVVSLLSTTGGLSIAGSAGLAVTGPTTLSGAATAPTAPADDSSTNIANTGWVWNRGMQAGGQQALPAGALTLSDAYAGFNCLAQTGAQTITFPNAASAGTGLNRTFTISNINTVPITLAFPGGSDAPTTLPAGGKIILVGDGNGYWRLVSLSGNHLLFSQQGYEMSPGGILRQWGTSGSVPAGGSLAGTFPIPFPNACWNMVALPGASVGAGSIWNAIINPTGYTLANSGTVASACYWEAIGY